MMIAEIRDSRFIGAAGAICPFEETAGNICSASLSRFSVGYARRAEYCSTENYDACPFFLSRVIRKKY